MKKISLLIILIIILSIPVFINAKSYTVEVSKTNNYMNRSNYSKTYKRYLKYSDSHKLKLGFYDGKVEKDNDFDTVTGFISSEEYKLTLPSTGTSYLYDGTTYWTLTGNSKKETIFFSEIVDNYGLKTVDKTTTNPNIDSRATVYVEGSTNVTGTGKQTDPWIFVPRFQLIVKLSDEKHAKIKDENGVDLEGEFSTYLVTRKNSGSGEARVIVSLEPGYMLMSNDCNGKITDTENENQKRFTISNISRDTKCMLAIGTGRFKVKLGKETYDNPTPKIIYLRHRDNYYKDEGYTEIIRKIEKPSRMGYTFDGYSNGLKEIIDKEGNIKDKVSITSTNAKDDNNKDIVLLTSAWHPNEYEVEFRPNGGMIDESTSSVKRKYLYERKYNERYTSFPIATRAGYSFSGWYTKASGGTKVTEDEELDTLGKVLYAHWDKCKKGTYNDGSLASCKACEKGTYQDEEGKSSCIKCTAGSYQNQIGQSGCMACKDGKTSNKENTACTENCQNTLGVTSWKDAKWELNNTVSNWCEVKTCDSKYKIDGNRCILKQMEWTFNYTGGIQELPIPYTGAYMLEVWGAQGGYDGSNQGGKGGYAKGIAWLNEGTKIYIVVGGAGESVASNAKGGYNGGGNAGKHEKSGGGGGATHIGFQNSLLKNTPISNVLIVAGGGGGAGYSCHKTGGDGGGESGGNADGNGGTQSSGGFGSPSGSYGQGGSRPNDFSADGGGGGGGLYGGGASNCNANSYKDGGGGGGSGYIGNLSNASMSSGIQYGDGKAKVSFGY